MGVGEVGAPQRIAGLLDAAGEGTALARHMEWGTIQERDSRLRKAVKAGRAVVIAAYPTCTSRS